MRSLAQTFIRRRSANRRRRRHNLRSSFEQLESRQLLAAAPLDFLDRFVAEGSGGLQRPRMVTFGPDVTGDGIQELYVSSGDNDAVMRYDGATAAPLLAPNKSGSEFVSPGAGGLDYPGDLAFGPDNTLYVSSSNTNAVLRFDGGSGEFLGTIVGGLAPTPETGSNGAPFGLTFGNDGNLYIANEGADEVLRYNPSTGTTSVFIPAGLGGLDRPRKVAFGPDANGDGVAELYVASPGTKQVLRYDGVSGGSPAVFFTTPLIAGPSWLEFGTDGDLYTTGRTSALSLDAAVVRLDVVSRAVDRFDLRRDGLWFALGSDNIVYNPGTSTGSFIDRFAETTTLDQTKFYVVNDGDDRTFVYGETGAPTQDYPITNTTPRGAAAAGFTTLVVDANKEVYVYDVHGSVLGSWTATGLSSTAQLEGVATNGADVWLVDNKTDRVFRYSKSAGRVSGSQSYDFGFYLNSGNKSGADLYTSGGVVSVTADKADLSGTITAAGQTVQLAPRTAGTAINLGSTVDTTASTLELSDAELDRITAGMLRIGSISSGGVTVSQTLSPAAASTLHLLSGSTINQSGAGGLQVANLAAETGTGIELASANNNVDTVALATSTGGLSFMDVNGFTLSAVDGVQGAVAAANVQLGVTGPGDVTVSRNIQAGTLVLLNLQAPNSLLTIEDGVQVTAPAAPHDAGTSCRRPNGAHRRSTSKISRWRTVVHCRPQPGRQSPRQVEESGPDES